MDPTPFDAESFLSLKSLTTPDPLFALPTILGIITLANVESYKWFQTDVQRDQEQKQLALAKERRAKGEIVLPWRNILRTGMRLATPVRMIIAGIMPGVRA
jgi:inner membrane protein COX18